MPQATFNGTTKTVNVEKCTTYENTLKTCKDKFNTKSISIVVKDGHLLDEINVKNIDNNSILRCYTTFEYKNLSIKDKLKIKQDKKIKNIPKPAPITSLCKFSKYPHKIDIRLKYISSLMGIAGIHIYPNVSHNNLFPKGSVVVSENIYPSIGLRFGRGTTVYFVENIEPKLKKLRSLQLNLFDGYAEIHKIVNYYETGYDNYNYIIMVRMSMSDKSKTIIDETVKRDTSSIKYGCTSRENNYLINECYKLIEQTKKLREIACNKILNKLNIKNFKKIVDQTENSIYNCDNIYYTLTNVTDCRDSKINIVTGSRNTPSFIVEPLTNFLPSGSGRKLDYSDTIELAKTDIGHLSGEMRNNHLICNTTDRKTIYQKYYKGYKNINNTIKDLEVNNLARILLKTEPIVNYKF